MDALIGHTGFVGGTLLRQRPFDKLYASSNIAEVRGAGFDTVICAAAPAAKWIADRDPHADLANIQKLAAELGAMHAKRFVLISTVDVFAHNQGKDEDSPLTEPDLTPYGRNRGWLERFVKERFPDALIVRLPGLVGPGLRKNVIFDFHNGNNLNVVDARAVFQFYPMVNLWNDLQVAQRAGLELLHLTAEPLSVADVAREGFGFEFDNHVETRTPPRYDFQTRHAAAFGGRGRYTYSRAESLLAIRAYAQSEPRGKPLA
jgi:dTDP-4-dehydrorhamnose reductase